MRADVLPLSVFGSNVRGIARYSEWERIRLLVSARAGKRCEICEGESHGPRQKVQHPDCHEIWRFELRDGAITQTLVGFIALCKKCHDTQHVGRSPDIEEAERVLARVNGWTEDEAHADVRRAFARLKFLEDSDIGLDLSILVGQIVVHGAPSLVFTSQERSSYGNSWARTKKAPQNGELDLGL